MIQPEVPTLVEIAFECQQFEDSVDLGHNCYRNV